jgi:hypothetical protein
LQVFFADFFISNPQQGAQQQVLQKQETPVAGGKSLQIPAQGGKLVLRHVGKMPQENWFTAAKR